MNPQTCRDPQGKHEYPLIIEAAGDDSIHYLPQFYHVLRFCELDMSESDGVVFSGFSVTEEMTSALKYLNDDAALTIQFQGGSVSDQVVAWITGPEGPEEIGTFAFRNGCIHHLDDLVTQAFPRKLFYNDVAILDLSGNDLSQLDEDGRENVRGLACGHFDEVRLCGCGIDDDFFEVVLEGCVSNLVSLLDVSYNPKLTGAHLCAALLAGGNLDTFYFNGNPSDGLFEAVCSLLETINNEEFALHFYECGFTPEQRALLLQCESCSVNVES